MNSPIEISNGRDAVKIYRVSNRGLSLFPVALDFEVNGRARSGLKGLFESVGFW